MKLRPIKSDITMKNEQSLTPRYGWRLRFDIEKISTRHGGKYHDGYYGNRARRGRNIEPGGTQQRTRKAQDTEPAGDTIWSQEKT